MKATTATYVGTYCALVSTILLFYIACGTPIAPKEICVQWAHVTDGGSFVLDDAGEAEAGR